MTRRILQLGFTIAATLAICGAGAAAASAAAAPATATTGPASNVTATSATLSGVVHTNGQPSTAWQFEYGTSARYGTFTAAHTTAAHGDVPVSVRVTALKPGTVYHFQLVALSSVSITPTTYTLLASPGGDATFRTETLGRLGLRKASLVVKRNRATFVSLGCARTGPATSSCVGRLVITTRVRSRNRFVKLYCGGAFFAIGLGHPKRVRVRVTKVCMRVLQGIPSRRISGTLSASMDGRVRLRRGVTLILG